VFGGSQSPGVLSTGRRRLTRAGGSGASVLPETTTGAERGPLVYGALPPTLKAQIMSPLVISP